jgi:hypothetical protein
MSEILRIEKDEKHNEYDVSFYSHGHNGKSGGLLHRLRLIWKIITTGVPYGDDICLSQEEIDKMIKFLNEVKK